MQAIVKKVWNTVSSVLVALVVLLALLLAGALSFGALFGAVMYGSYDHISGDPKIMIVLGCQVKPWGPSILLQDRLNEALAYLEDHPDMTVVVSGGQGYDEPSTEARAMADYLADHGFPEEQILLEERSSNTVQNLRYSCDLLAGQGYDTTDDILVVSNGFHPGQVKAVGHHENALFHVQTVLLHQLGTEHKILEGVVGSVLHQNSSGIHPGRHQIVPHNGGLTVVFVRA